MKAGDKADYVGCYVNLRGPVVLIEPGGDADSWLVKVDYAGGPVEIVQAATVNLLPR